MTDYTQLITSEHADKPKFSALVQAVAGGIDAINASVLSLPQAFDLDVAAGKQLDVIGLWVGQPRDVAGVPLTVYFGFEDNVAAEIFGEQGLPQIGARFYEEGDEFESTVVLADPEYRLLLKSKIVRNQSDGTAVDLMQALLYLFGFVKANYLLWSEALDNALWVKTGVSIAADSQTAPDAAVTADRVTAIAGTSSHQIRSNMLAVIAGAACFSIHVKYVNSQYLKVALDDTLSGSRVIATFDIQNGLVASEQTVGQATQLQSGVIALAGGWFRCWVSGVIPPIASGPRKRALFMYTPSVISGGYPSFALAGTEQFDAWGAQLEPGAAPGPYLRVGAVNTAKIVDTNNKVVTIQLPEALVSLTQLALLENLDLLPRTAGIAYTIQTI